MDKIEISDAATFGVEHGTVNDVRVFAHVGDDWSVDDIMAGVRMEPVYRSANGERSRYPFAIMAVNDRCFLPGVGRAAGNKVCVAASIYAAKHRGVKFVTFPCKHEGVDGLAIRRVV